MKVSTVVTATDLNPLYCEFIPYFINAWTSLFPAISICVLLIAHEIPASLEAYSDCIHLIEPVAGVHTALQAQCIRLLYPSTVDTKDAVLITDMDMIPLNRKFYTSIANVADDTFVSYRPHPPGYPNEIYMCYCAATPSVWKAVIAPYTKGTLQETLEEWNAKVRYNGKHGGSGWNTDQLILCKAYKQYSGPKAMLRDGDTGYNRLCRDNSRTINDKDMHTKIQAGVYSDYHCRRPYSKHKEFNDSILFDLQMQVLSYQTSS
jgi:hypothetical protein